MFITYARKLFEVIKDHLPSVHAYADDTQVCLCFKPDGFLKNEIRCYENNGDVLTTSGLNKTEFVVIGTQHQLGKLSIG